MIINLRGTSGSGKSTVVRRVMEHYILKEPFHIEGRKQPLSYALRQHESELKFLRVLGHYETACGGCDTITSPDTVYQIARHMMGMGDHILYEGIIIGDDVRRCAELNKECEKVHGQKLRVIALNTPLDLCLAGIQARRDVRGDDRILNPENTSKRAERLKGMVSRLRTAGVRVDWMSREEAYQECLKEFGLV